jgi:DNA repair exonuclease SbcCD ATPase subunit
MDTNAKVIDHPKKDTAPALGFSFSVDLTNGKTVVVQTHLPNDCPPEALDAMLDKMAKAGSRQKAREELKALKAQLKQHHKSLRHQKEDADRLDRDHKKAEEAHKLRLSALAEQKDAAAGEAKSAHAASGRRTEMRELPPRDRRAIEAINSAVKSAQAEWAQVEAKRNADMAGYQTNVARYEEAIAEIEADIAECKKLLGGEE